MLIYKPIVIFVVFLTSLTIIIIIFLCAHPINIKFWAFYDRREEEAFFLLVVGLRPGPLRRRPWATPEQY